MIEFRPFRPEDAAPVLGFVPDHALIGVTAERNGRLACYGGVHLYEGRHWVFFHLADETLRRPMFLHRTVVRGLMAILNGGDIRPVYALCDESKVRAREWLAALGFREMSDHEKDAGIRELEARCNGSAWVKL